MAAVLGTCDTKIDETKPLMSRSLKNLVERGVCQEGFTEEVMVGPYLENMSRRSQKKRWKYMLIRGRASPS